MHIVHCELHTQLQSHKHSQGERKRCIRAWNRSGGSKRGQGQKVKIDGIEMLDLYEKLFLLSMHSMLRI